MRVKHQRFIGPCLLGLRPHMKVRAWHYTGVPFGMWVEAATKWLVVRPRHHLICMFHISIAAQESPASAFHLDACSNAVQLAV
jgi:hypothetical protein